MKKITGLFLIIVLAFTACQEKTKKQEFVKQELNFGLTKYVNPFIGTGGHGHTYPGAAYPFGMMQLSPDTRLSGWDGCGGYHYSDSIVYGFSHTHLSGTGCTDYGDLLLMPTTGNLHMDNGAIDPAKGYCSKFSHDHEKASAGYYSVLLDDYNIQVELTTNKRSGIHKYTFNEESKAHVILDLVHRDKVLSSDIEIIDEHTIKGHRRSKEWAGDQHFYFYIQFSEPFVNHGFENDGEMTEGKKEEGTALKAFFDFDTKAGDIILAKVGMSAVSTDGAKKNLEAEVGAMTFDEAVNSVTKAWENELGKIVVKGGSEDDKQIFYTALYHSYLNPNLFTDVDGQYRGMDLKVHQAQDHQAYTVFSLWDTFRATHPLFTITQQQRTLDFIKTFIKMYEQGGRLPVWELCANETDCMIGYHSIPVIADAYMKGLRDFDAEKALEAMISSAGEDHFGLKHYKKFGYIPASHESESVSKTLEYAYDDWCIAVMAKEMGKEDVYDEFIERAQYWKNLYDESTRFMRAKMDASWFAPFDAHEVNFNYTEANAWQYNFFVPHDVNTMMNVMGGEESFASFLDQLFTQKVETTGRHQADITGLIGQYAHGNEPSHHMAYLYNFAGKPWKTQQRVRQVMSDLYTTQPDGLSGNEDCGQMSSWYVLSAMGFYSVTPALPEYVIGSPVFDEITINLENGKQFTIVAKGNSPENIYVQSAKLNGKDYVKTILKHEDILHGGELILQMSAQVNKDWGVPKENRPVTVIDENLIVPVPSINGVKVFKGSTEVVISCLDKEAKLHYTLDGTEPSDKSPVYNEPIKLLESNTIKAIAVKGGETSFMVASDFMKLNEKRSLKLFSEYANQYNAGGDNALIDMIKGPENFRTGAWQGYEGIDLKAVVDLGENVNAEKLSIGFIQDMGAWIFLPEYVEFFVSVDGRQYHKAGKVSHQIALDHEGPVLNPFEVKLNAKNIRYVKVMAKNIGICPDWHLGAGGKAWIFADEITVE